eukprot:7273932-Pyramimonas_sp.AAC.1
MPPRRPKRPEARKIAPRRHKIPPRRPQDVFEHCTYADGFNGLQDGVERPRRARGRPKSDPDSQRRPQYGSRGLQDPPIPSTDERSERDTKKRK